MLIQIISCLFEWNLTGRFLSRDHISCFWSNIVQAYNCRTKCWPSTFLSIDCITNSNFQLICCPTLLGDVPVKFIGNYFVTFV